jgi:hypothetical protein
MIRVLTVAREFGSGGLTISRLVANRLKWRLFDREIVDEVIRMAGVDRDAAERCDENYDPMFHRLLKSLWHGGFETSTAQITPALFDSAEMTRCARSVIEQAANQGNCVIVGRGAQCLLSGREDALHTFIWAPRAWRVRRIAQRLPDERHPEQLMDRVDRARIAFLRQSFDANWCDHRLYDLVVNSALGEEAAADCIAAAIGVGSRADG